MKHLLLTTIAAVLVVGCGESQQSAPAPEVKPAELTAEATKAEPPTAKAPDILLIEAAAEGNIEAVKQHLTAGVDVNAKNENGTTPLHRAAYWGHKEVIELLIAEGADINAKNGGRRAPLDYAIWGNETESANLLRKHGGKTAEELKAEGK